MVENDYFCKYFQQTEKKKKKVKLFKYSIMVYFVLEVINTDEEFDCIQFNFVVNG